MSFDPLWIGWQRICQLFGCARRDWDVTHPIMISSYQYYTPLFLDRLFSLDYFQLAFAKRLWVTCWLHHGQCLPKDCLADDCLKGNCPNGNCWNDRLNDNHPDDCLSIDCLSIDSWSNDNWSNDFQPNFVGKMTFSKSDAEPFLLNSSKTSQKNPVSTFPIRIFCSFSKSQFNSYYPFTSYWPNKVLMKLFYPSLNVYLPR